MNIAVIFGGKSCEHNISIATGVGIANTIKDSGHRIICIYIDKKGVWRTSTSLFDIEVFKGDAGGRKVYLLPGDNRLHFCGSLKKITIDCAVLCNHGRNGEDGTLQGLLELSGIAYTGCAVTASALGMDKILMKKVFTCDKIPVVKWRAFDKTETTETITKKVMTYPSLPVIVKPANAGSSIGIGIAHTQSELSSLIDAAFIWDNKIIIEKALTDFTELNCAVIGGCGEIMVGEVEKPASASEFLTYDDKYHGNCKMSCSREFPAPIDENTRKLVQKLALKSFNAIDASGIARIDFLLDNKTGKLYVNEINTIPGSLALYLFPDKSPAELIFILINIAIKRKEMLKKLKFEYKDKDFMKKG